MMMQPLHNNLEEDHDSGGDDDVSDSSADHAVEQHNKDDQDDIPRRRHRKGNAVASKEEGPACQSCRKKKAKCSRKQPCSQCQKNRAECIYDDAKSKPGMRAGAIEILTQRLATLENMFMGQSMVWQQVWRHMETFGNGNVSNASTDSPTPAALVSGPSLQESALELRKSLSAIGNQGNANPEALRNIFNPSREAKRRRIDDGRPVGSSATTSVLASPAPLPDDLVDALVDIYFERVHPWVPMLHAGKFRQDMADPEQRRSKSSILHAITSLCTRFSDDPRLGNAESRTMLSKRCRDTVILQSMEFFSVANLQALIICAFDTIVSGRGPSSWSIVGSMTRTAEQLQLGVEDGDISQSEAASNGTISRIAFLPPPTSWCEEEERRRVFWNVFLMDRFCSISTGWNLSLTSADARRRLPCEGGLWEAGQRLDHPTPYFGLSDQSGRTGVVLPDARPETQDQCSLGGFAYAIEATESLSLVTSFFMQQTVNTSIPQQMQMWFVGFKQLDLRLIQWKVFLPEQWREACALNADGNMDPNLTLAHITHNTAVVLLHQGIAYPSIEWQQSTAIKLPSQSSAETCMAAAVEVATIAENFLRNSGFLANHQFAFCLFVCGRMLLAHATYFQTPLTSSFDSLILSLQEISNRWGGTWSLSSSITSATPTRSTNLASKFASRLSKARDSGTTTFDIRQAAYSEETGNSEPLGQNASAGQIRMNVADSSDRRKESGDQTGWSAKDLSLSGNTDGSPDSISLAFPPLPQAFQSSYPGQKSGNSASPAAIPGIMNSESVFGYHELPLSSTQLGDSGGPGDGTLEDISAYLHGSFQPDQRISMYSQQAFQPG